MRRTDRLLRPIVSSRRPQRTHLKVESLEGRDVPSTVTGSVFRDVNGDGIRQASDPAIAAVTVQIFDGNDTLVGTTTSGIAGVYTFKTLAASSEYEIRIDLSQAKLANLTPTPEDQGDDDTVDSDFVLDSDNNIATVDVTTDDSGTDTQTFDAGFTSATANLTLGGTVFNDADGSGTFDDGETTVAGVSVDLIGSTSVAVQATTTTDANGAYSFSGLVAGDYRVRLSASNFSGTGKLVGLTPSSDPDTDPNDDVTGDNNGEVSGTLGSGGVVVTEPITLSAGDEPTDDGDTNPNTNLSLDFGMTTADTGGDGTGGEQTGTASLAGRVFLDYNNNGTADGPDGGVSGVTVTLTGGDLAAPQIRQTAIDGSFSFTGLNAGTYTITETQPTTPANRSGKSTLGDAAGSTATANVISGIVLADSTAATGYTFGEVPLVDTNGHVYIDGNSDGTFDDGEAGIAGVTVTLTGTNVIDSVSTARTATTDSLGAYSFTGLPPGTYAITETQPAGFTDGQLQNGSPAGTLGSNTFTGIDLTLAASVGGYNFGEIANSVPTPGTGSISGIVFVDTNGNGAQDSGDTGIAGVTIRLTGVPSAAVAVDQTTITGSDGSFSFTGLAAGVYAIAETQPSGNQDGIDTAGTANGNTSVNDTISAITLTAGESATGYRFAEGATTTTPVATSDLLPQLTLSETTAKPGTTVVITASIKNNGTAAATATTANVVLSGLVFVSASSTDYNATTHAWAVGDVAAGATSTIEITARVPAAGSFAPAVRITATTPSLAASATKVASAVVTASAPAAAVVVTGTQKFWFLSSSWFGAARTAPAPVPAPTPAPPVDPPVTPTVGLATASDTGTVGDDSTDLATVTLTGLTTPGATVRLLGRTTTTKADATGAYSFANVGLTTGTNNFTIRVANAGGTNSTTTTITRIEEAPTAPTLVLATASDTGTVGDGSTSLTNVILNGTTTPGAGVTLIETGATTTANGAGAFVFTGVPLALGANTFTAKATNSGGTTIGTATTFTRVAASTDATPTVKTALAPVSAAAGASQTIDLAGSFDDADITDTIVTFNTSAGPVNIELFDKQAPKTVANFLNYVNSGKYTNAIFHRSASSNGVPFVLQGGGFTFQPGTTPTIATIATDPTVQNEPDAVNRSNLKGTLAMAKLGGDPNSASDQFFFNLGNNSANLDAQNGGFTVFGKVVSAADQAVIDALAAMPTQDESTAAGLSASQKSAFGEVPLQNYTGTNFPTDTTAANYAIINSATITQQTEVLTYSIVSNSNPAAATATIANNRVTVLGVATGTTTVTVRATDKAGAFVDTTMTVTVP